MGGRRVEGPWADLAAVEELRSSLARRPPEIPPKFLYDDRGSALFEEITRLPEYYPTRDERLLLAERAEEVALAAGPRVADVVELGSGAAWKTLPLLDAIAAAGQPPRYVAVDISAHALDRTRELLVSRPGVAVRSVLADYSRGLRLPAERARGARLVLFLGGTIGNEEDAAALRLLRSVRGEIEAGDCLLLGVNLAGDPRVIEAAYNDPAGVTAAFNKNVLRALNALVGSCFDPDDFEHRAPYRVELAQVEMWLCARRALWVDLGSLGGPLRLERGEGIRTEISRRFTHGDLVRLLAAAGFAETAWFASPDGLFALMLGRAR